MISAGICASDSHIAWGHMQTNNLPMVLGHEGLALVESVGSAVKNIRAGDLVLSNIMSQCGKCEACQDKSINFCEVDGFMVPSARPNKQLPDGTPVWGFCRLGVYSEYVLLQESQVVKIDPRLNKVNACIISCAVMTGFYSATHLAKVTPSSTVCVIGMGAIGLNAVYGCKFNGAKNIIGIDINNSKKEIALHFGATEFLNPQELDKPVEQYLKEKYGGVHFAIECIGNQQVMESAFKSLKPTGTLALVGVGAKMLNFSVIEMLSGRSIVGGFLGKKRSDEGFAELGELYLNGQYDIDRLVTHQFKLEQINEAFQTLKEGKCIRSIIIF